ncbi:MAG: NAD-dependent epimerase/dehydratase family protein [Gemmatimonadaceae bacterium]|nr:NAD-dependent epimerase/dehydratase family protein [Gemmatimonadaceae bacterium]
MTDTRRDFIRSTALAGAALALRPATTLASVPNGHDLTAPARAPSTTPRPGAAKKLLILGGTGFIGPHTVKYALERGHQVTILTRGRSSTKVEGVEHIIADREGDLAALSGRRWDAVLDNNARDYRWVQRSTRALKDSTDYYLFVSSISAYKTPAFSYASASDVRTTPVLENAERFAATADFKDGQEVPYGLTKALSENIVNAAFPGHAAIVRPGLIVGPTDPTDRWTYWPVRIDEGGEVLAPGNPEHSSQVIDQRDLTEFIVRLAEGGVTGAFNATGPATRLTFAEMLAGCRAATSAAVSFTWVPESFLAEQKLGIWSDIPAWAPGDPIMYVSVARAVAAGLTYRPLAVTAMDTIAWDKGRPAAEREKRQAGMPRSREREVLAAWKARRR